MAEDGVVEFCDEGGRAQVRPESDQGDFDFEVRLPIEALPGESLSRLSAAAARLV